MPNLDTKDLHDMAGAIYFVVGRGTEGGPASYRLSIAGITARTSDPNWGDAERIKANSGYTIGTIQVDLGQRGTWALGATDAAELKAGEATYVDAIIAQSSAYANARALPFTHDHTQLRADLLSHGNGKNHRSTLTFIDADTRDSINSWASSEEGEKWIHKNIDYPQVKNATQTAMDILNRYGKNVSEDHRFEAVAILAKTANQMPGALKTYKKVLGDGGDFNDLISTANGIHRRLDWYDGPKAASIAKQYKQALDDPMVAAAIHRAHAKVGDANFNPLKSATDPDIEQALKTIGQGHRNQAKILHQGSQGREVITLQAKLNKLGLTDSHGHALKPDGDFGPATRAAVEGFQKAHGMKADGIVGPKTMEALDAARKPDHLSLDDTRHAGNAMYIQALGHVSALDAQVGRTPDELSIQFAGSLATAAYLRGMTRIDEVALSEDGSRAFAMQSRTSPPGTQVAKVDVAQSVATPLQQSSAEFQAISQQQSSPQTDKQQTQSTQQAPQRPEPQGMLR